VHNSIPFIRPDTFTIDLPAEWSINFNSAYGGPAKPILVKNLKTWEKFADSTIKYYSGTAVYSQTFTIDDPRINSQNRTTIQFDSIYNIATVKVNGVECGTLWTYPYTLDISKALKQGSNKITIEVTNSWHNRLIGDNLLPEQDRITWTTAPFRLKDKPLLPGGLTGKIRLTVYQQAREVK
jgi:hypothetical protein